MYCICIVVGRIYRLFLVFKMMENTNTVGEDKEENKLKVDLNTIFSTELGRFGKFQIRILGFAVILAIFATWSSNEFLFTTARIPTRCVIPECDDSELEWSPYWLPNAIPATSATTFDHCQRFVNPNTSTPIRQVQSSTCPSELFDRNTLQPCEEYVYENTHSVAYDFGLACDEWRRSLMGTIRTFGTLAALPITGYFSDRWGRRIALTLNAINTAWLGIVRYWAGTYMGFILSEFFEAMFGSGIFSSIYILLAEVMGPKNRVACGAVLNSSLSIGKVTLGLIAWNVPNWRHLTLTLYIPQLISIFFYWLLTESPLWYMSKGRLNDCEVLLKKIAKINGAKLSDESLRALRENALEEARNRVLEEERNDLNTVSLTVYLISKLSIAMVLTIIYVYTAELYPTKYRHSLFAYSSMLGRIGSMSAPLTPAIATQWFEKLPFVLFAGFALLSGALVFTTPETLGSKLPDTFEEASQIGLKSSNDNK